MMPRPVPQAPIARPATPLPCPCGGPGRWLYVIGRPAGIDPGHGLMALPTPTRTFCSRACAPEGWPGLTSETVGKPSRKMGKPA